MSSAAPVQPPALKKKPVSFSNILLGAGLNMCEVTTLGQPLEVIKTTMAAHRDLNFLGAMRHVWSRGGVFGFYQGLIPWAWIEASTKGAVLLFVASESEYRFKSMGLGNFASGILGGITGGVAQSYLTMGFCTCMKTVEITMKKGAEGAPAQSSWGVFRTIYAKEGLRGIYKGVNAVAIRQMTNWGSRFGLSRLVEDIIRKTTGKTSKDDKLSALEKISASAIGGGLSAWNQPIEVIRVEMQSKKADPNRPKNLTVASTFKYIYSTNGIKGLYRGITPRIGLGVWQTVFMVGFGDMAREFVAKVTGEAPTAKH
ncbi:Yhm2 protein [Maudiozyma humilis]|uniref:Yhm2 protein n=1 Tax=Maudiozyma humilis TaxID=51915 RepID=A0AAV5S1L7_MAUHU|nr:Yhm2 protein [Kazachstania humilis]